MRQLSTASKGLTLIEVVFSMVILLMAGLATISAIIYTRQSMELDKQRLTALNYCRQSMEAATTLADVEPGEKLLVPFNEPGLEIPAKVSVEYFPILNNGTVHWTSPLVARPPDEPVFCRVTVTWKPSGRWSRPQVVSMCSIIRAGTT